MNEPKYKRTNIYLEKYQYWFLYNKDRKKATGLSGTFLVRQAIDHYIENVLKIDLDKIKEKV